METFKPYNLTTWARPKKTCVFIDAQWESAYKFVCDFIKRCHSNWGGAYSPIFLYNNQDPSYDEQFEKLLLEYDPDQVLFLGKVSASVKERMDCFLMPFESSGPRLQY